MVEMLKFIAKSLNEMTFFVECFILVSLFFSVLPQLFVGWQGQYRHHRLCQQERARGQNSESNFRPEQEHFLALARQSSVQS